MPLVPFFILMLVLATPSGAEEPHPNLGAHFKHNTAFENVVDLRCTRCHNRERVQEALREQKDVMVLQRRMIEHGAVLTPRDKRVLGTFWGNPLREKEGESSLPDSETFEQE